MGAFGFVTVLPSEHICLAMLPDEHHGTPTGPEFGPLCGSGWGEGRHPADRTEPLLDEVEHVLWNVMFRYHDHLGCWRQGGKVGLHSSAYELLGLPLGCTLQAAAPGRDIGEMDSNWVFGKLFVTPETCP